MTLAGGAQRAVEAEDVHDREWNNNSFDSSHSGRRSGLHTLRKSLPILGRNVNEVEIG